MTELEVNRLCKQVLPDFISNGPAIAVENVNEEAFSDPKTESLLYVTKADVEMQTDEIEVSTKSTQVTVEQVTLAQAQTEVPVSANTSVIEQLLSGISQGELKDKLTDDQLESIVGSLSAEKMFQLLLDNFDSSTIMKEVLDYHCKDIPESSKPSAELAFLKEVLLESYESKALVSLCLEILKNLNDNRA